MPDSVSLPLLVLLPLGGRPFGPPATWGSLRDSTRCAPPSACDPGCESLVSPGRWQALCRGPLSPWPSVTVARPLPSVLACLGISDTGMPRSAVVEVTETRSPRDILCHPVPSRGAGVVQQWDRIINYTMFPGMSFSLKPSMRKTRLIPLLLRHSVGLSLERLIRALTRQSPRRPPCVSGTDRLSGVTLGGDARAFLALAPRGSPAPTSSVPGAPAVVTTTEVP